MNPFTKLNLISSLSSVVILKKKKKEQKSHLNVWTSVNSRPKRSRLLPPGAACASMEQGLGPALAVGVALGWLGHYFSHCAQVTPDPASDLLKQTFPSMPLLG